MIFPCFVICFMIISEYLGLVGNRLQLGLGVGDKFNGYTELQRNRVKDGNECWGWLYFFTFYQNYYCFTFLW